MIVVYYIETQALISLDIDRRKKDNATEFLKQS